ncbi:MAG: exo-alpha-sialidase, partial [Methylococcales bacterium]
MPTGEPGPEILVDDDVCSCCNTGIAAQGNDWLVAYRDRRADEVRDIALARHRKNRIASGPIHDDHWAIQGCPSNGPAVAWRGSQVLAAWFAAADGKGRVKTAFSTDNGKTFGTPVELDADANGYVNALLLLEDGSGIIAWRGRAGPLDELRTARVLFDGTIKDRSTLYRGDFPKWPSRHLSLARAGNGIFVAWTDPEGSRVR